jgi:hypothetical protein
VDDDGVDELNMEPPTGWRALPRSARAGIQAAVVVAAVCLASRYVGLGTLLVAAIAFGWFWFLDPVLYRPRQEETPD